MASMLGFLNRLLPFATPGTPLIQDIVHLAGISALLYFAPQIQERLQRQRLAHEPVIQTENPDLDPDVQEEEHIHQPRIPPPTPTVEDASESESESDDDDRDDPAEAAFPHQQPMIPAIDDAAGPAQPQPAQNAATGQRAVGAKKAKSLARRDQRRAYHEFMRNQGEAQRARDAEGAEAREAELAAKRERRRAVEAELERKKAAEREARKVAERVEREEESARRQRVVGFVRAELERARMCDLLDVVREVGGEVDDVWARKIVVSSGLLGKKDGSMTMITGTGWVVRVEQEDVNRMYKKAAAMAAADVGGKVTYDQMGMLLETVIRDR